MAYMNLHECVWFFIMKSLFDYHMDGMLTIKRTNRILDVWNNLKSLITEKLGNAYKQCFVIINGIQINFDITFNQNNIISRFFFNLCG